MQRKDTLYRHRDSAGSDFVFDDAVASVFSDMITRSVPGYGMTLSMLELIAARFGQPASQVYDLGCSLGEGLIALSRGLGKLECRLIGVDNSPAMVERCQSAFADTRSSRAVDVICGDLTQTPIENASLVVLNFTLQFIDVSKRQQLIDTIYEGLNKGGALVLSEKIQLADTCLNTLNAELHTQFKQLNGYSELEITRKRNALEAVLVPETLEMHTARLQRAGFSLYGHWFRCFNFVSWVAIKE